MPIFTPPVFKYQFSPTTNPFAAPVWVDITPYILDFQSKYGRQFELNRMETGEATFTLDNEDRRFDPTNTSGPYSPNLLPMKKFQAYAPNVIPINSGSTATVTTSAAGTGSSGYTVTSTPATYHDGLFTASRVQVPSIGMSSTQGWLAIRMKMGFASTAYPRATIGFFEWGDGTSSNRIGLYLTNANSFTAYRQSGGVGGSTNLASGSFSAGATFTVIVRWTSTDIGISVNGSTFHQQGGNTSIPNLSAVTNYDVGNLTFSPGTDIADSTTMWSASGSGTLSDADAAAIASIPDVLTIWSATSTEPVGDATMMCWPSNASMVSVFPAISTILRVPSTAYIFTGYIDQWPMKWEGPGVSTVECRAVDALEPLAQADIVSTSSTLTTTFGGNADLTFTSVGIGSGNNLITIAYNNNATEPPTVTLSNAVAITVNIQAGTTTATEIMNAINSDPNASLLVTVSLAPGSSGAGFPPAMTATNLGNGQFTQELAGARINNVLDMIGWPSTDRIIDVGRATVAAQTFRASDHQKAKLHLNDVENSEGIGYIFVNGQGYVVFHDRAHRSTSSLSTTSQGVFGDLAPELEYDNIVPSFDKTYIFNDVEITSYGSTAAQTAKDTTSIGQYMIRTYALSTQLVSTADALQLAQYLLSIYAQPAIRFTSMTFTPMNDIGLWLQAFARTIGDRITVNRRPPHYGATAGPTISLDCFVESVEWKMNPGLIDASLAYELSPSSVIRPYFTLDSATLGTLDSGNALSI